MNYEIQYRDPYIKKWARWASHLGIRSTKNHIAIIRKDHPSLKFRIVRVTRKVVE